MYWKSFADFLAMGNHGFYVWGSVAVFAIVLVLEPVFIVRGHTRLLARLRRELNINAGEAVRNRPSREK